MADTGATIRTTYYRSAIVVATLWSVFSTFSVMGQDQQEAADTSAFNTTEGTNQGMIHDVPDWSFGIQVGTNTNSGVSAQKMGFNGNGLNLGLGVLAGDLAVHADYIWFLAKGFTTRTIPAGQGYSAFRGTVLPYVGVGAQVGDGVYLRTPAGVQYTLIQDPVTFYGGLVLFVGSHKNDDIGVSLGAVVGARLLL